MITNKCLNNNMITNKCLNNRGAALPMNTPGVPCIFDPLGRAGICGDWLTGSSIEAAVLSGFSLANHVNPHSLSLTFHNTPPWLTKMVTVYDIHQFNITLSKIVNTWSKTVVADS
jgi:hypothetical protein